MFYFISPFPALAGRHREIKGVPMRVQSGVP
jgi:hypothetical protein